MPEYIEITSNSDFMIQILGATNPNMQSSSSSEQTFFEKLPTELSDALIKAEFILNDIKLDKFTSVASLNDLSTQLSNAAKKININLTTDECASLTAFLAIRYLMHYSWFSALNSSLQQSTVYLKLKIEDILKVEYVQKERKIGGHTEKNLKGVARTFYKTKCTIKMNKEGDYTFQNDNTETIYLRDNFLKKKLLASAHAYLVAHQTLAVNDLYVLIPFLINKDFRDKFNKQLLRCSDEIKNQATKIIESCFFKETVRAEILKHLPNIKTVFNPYDELTTNLKKTTDKAENPPPTPAGFTTASDQVDTASTSQDALPPVTSAQITSNLTPLPSTNAPAFSESQLQQTGDGKENKREYSTSLNSDVLNLIRQEHGMNLTTTPPHLTVSPSPVQMYSPAKVDISTSGEQEYSGEADGTDQAGEVDSEIKAQHTLRTVTPGSIDGDLYGDIAVEHDVEHEEEQEEEQVAGQEADQEADQEAEHEENRDYDQEHEEEAEDETSRFSGESIPDGDSELIKLLARQSVTYDQSRSAIPVATQPTGSTLLLNTRAANAKPDQEDEDESQLTSDGEDSQLSSTILHHSPPLSHNTSPVVTAGGIDMLDFQLQSVSSAASSYVSGSNDDEEDEVKEDQGLAGTGALSDDAFTPQPSPTAATANQRDKDEEDDNQKKNELIVLEQVTPDMSKSAILALHVRNLDKIINSDGYDETQKAACLKLKTSMLALTEAQIEQSQPLLLQTIACAITAVTNPHDSANLESGQKLISPLKRSNFSKIALALTVIITGAVITLACTAIFFGALSAATLATAAGAEAGAGLLTKALAAVGGLIGLGMIYQGTRFFTPSPLDKVQDASNEVILQANRRLG